MNESDIESTSGLEKIAHVSYEDYFRYIENESLVEGKNTVDHNHTFFVRLARDTQFQNIEGFPIDSIYEKNILEHNMETERFMEWCREHNIPTPKNSDGTVTQAGKEYNEWYSQDFDRQKDAYEQWARTCNIDTAEGAVTRFIDEEAKSHYIKTDFENRGMIVG